MSPLLIPSYRPRKTVHVAHSFGSFLTASLLVHHPTLSDGALLTGYLLNPHLGTIDVAHFDHEFAAQHDPARFGAYPSGYFVLTTESDIQKLFFRGGGFEPELLAYGESIKQPEAVGEYASEGTVEFLPAVGYKGPVQVSSYPKVEGKGEGGEIN